MKTIIAVLLVALVAGCTSSEDAMRALSAQGFTDVRLTGYKWFACGEGDFYHTGFIATSPTGREVSGVVCSGLLFKNATVRF